MGSPCLAYCFTQANRPADTAVDRVIFDLPPCTRRTAGRRYCAHLSANAPVNPFDPDRIAAGEHQRFVVSNVGHRERTQRQATDNEARHLHFRKGTSHAVGINDRKVHLGGSEEGQDAVFRANLARHDCPEFDTGVVLHHLYGTQSMHRVRQTFLGDERRSHQAQLGYMIIIRKIVGRDQGDLGAVAVELLDIEQFEIRMRAAPGPENTGANRERTQIVCRDDTTCTHPAVP